MGFRANRRQPLDRLISGLPVIPTQSRTPPASSIGRDLQAVSTKSHAAPAASSLLAGVVEVQHTLSTLADAVTTGFGEQCCCDVCLRGQQFIWLFRISTQLYVSGCGKRI